MPRIIFVLSWNGIPIGAFYESEPEARDHAMYYSRNANCTITIYKTQLYYSQSLDLRVANRIASYRNGRLL